MVIRSATPSDRHRAIAVIVLAFATDPMARWSFPDPHDYISYCPELVRLFGGKAFELGSAYCIDDFSGAALWLPPGVHSDEEQMGALMQRTVPAERQEDAFAVFDKMGSYHPTEPHWYLPLIGVDPSRQGNGFGSALMKHALIPCDRDNIPAYLESSNPRNISLYERHGFERLGTIQAGSSPVVVPMLRRPVAG